MNASNKLYELATIQIGFQGRGRIASDPDGHWFLIQMSDAQPSGKYTRDGLTRLPHGAGSELYAVEPGVVLFQARGSVNRAHVVWKTPGRTMASNHFYILRPRLDIITPEYLAWAVNCTPVQAQLASLAQGATTSLVSKAAFESIEIPVPPLAVQQKIAWLAALQRQEAELSEYLVALREMLVEEVCLTSARASG